MFKFMYPLDYLNAVLVELGGAQILQAGCGTLLFNVQNAPDGDNQAILARRFALRPLGVSERGIRSIDGEN